ncbi:WXG100 family type VII secretion target [Actinomadura rayongensis]|uniref:ESAT-6-like protein n=1 Tax=Actinomadura rayongensis TaxID=1429076 RepID=A0A6I4W2B8_9ACTN|nr:WXG100 family type VII secretion target [Actinomadura rayongensis]MXQ64327.1 WXG100 family type VII secretion target [Actinomadura rayongensis]
MSQQSSVNRQHMQAAAGKIEEAHAQIGQLKTRLTGYHAQLQGAWKGESADAFTQVYNLFEGEFTKVQKDLDEIHQRLVDTKVKYDGSEQRRIEAVNRLRGAING